MATLLPCLNEGCDHPPFETAAGRSSHMRSAHGYKSKSKWATKWRKYAQDARDRKRAAIHKQKKYPCGVGKCEASFDYATAAGAHRWTAHGIAGKSNASIGYRKRKKEQQRIEREVEQQARKRNGHSVAIVKVDDLRCVICDTEPFKNMTGKRIHEASEPHQLKLRSINNNGNSESHSNGAETITLTRKEYEDELAIAHWSGRDTVIAEHLFTSDAHRIGVSDIDFTARCLAILQRSSKTLRERYRLFDHMSSTGL